MTYREQVLTRLVGHAPTIEFRFHPTRQWRFDFAWPEFKVALECEGAVWVRGRHTRGSGFVKDLEKYNTATALGWRLLRVQPGDLLTQATADLIRETMRRASPCSSL